LDSPDESWAVKARARMPCNRARNHGRAAPMHARQLPYPLRSGRRYFVCCAISFYVATLTRAFPHARTTVQSCGQGFAPTLSMCVRACVRASAVACVCVCVRARVSHARAPLRHRLESPLACSPPPLECEFQPPRHAHTPHVPVPRTDAGCGRGAATPSRRNHARIRTALEAGERFWCTRVLEAGPPAMDGFGAHGYWRCACRPCR
jgi:hypothetical protein